MFKKSICHVWKKYFHIQKFISMIRNFITHLQEILCLCESFPPPRSTSRYFYANEKYFYGKKLFLCQRKAFLCQQKVSPCQKWMKVWQIICWEVTMQWVIRREQNLWYYDCWPVWLCCCNAEHITNDISHIARLICIIIVHFWLHLYSVEQRVIFWV